MVALPGGTTASAKLWLPAFPDGVPASSRIEEPSAVMKALRCSRRTMSIERRLVSRCGRGLHWCGSLALTREAALDRSSGVPQNMARVWTSVRRQLLRLAVIGRGRFHAD